MSGDILQITIEIESEEAVRALERLGDGIRSAGFTQTVGEEVVSFSVNRILSRRNTAPDGTRWEDLTMATLLRKKKKGREHQGTLVQEGSMWRSIKAANPTEDTVEVGSDSLYGLIHQKGGQAGKSHKVTIPARPYIGVGKEDEDALGAFVVRCLKDWMAKG